jgi:phosphohistidine phosphatase
MKKLFIIRHAKSSWDQPELKDIDRPLNDRGEQDAPKMGEVLAERYQFDQLISSPANRAHTTCKIIAGKMGYPEKEIKVDRAIYGAAVSGMISMINTFDNKWETVAIFGHNPTFTYLAEQLGNESIGNLPTCGVVGIEFEVDDWNAVGSGLGNTFYYDYPKNHL